MGFINPGLISLYVPNFTLHILHPTLCTSTSTLHTPNSTRNTPHLTHTHTDTHTHTTRHTPHFTLYTHTPYSTPTLRTPHPTRYTPHSIYTPHLRLHIPHFLLQTPDSALHTQRATFPINTPLFILYTSNCTAFAPPHSTLHSLHWYGNRKRMYKIIVLCVRVRWLVLFLIGEWSCCQHL